MAVLDESGLVDYTKFFATLGVTLKPDDSRGVSHKIIESSQQTEEEHNADQKDRSISCACYII